MAGKENIWTCLFFVGVVVGLPSYMTEPFRKLGLRFWILPFAYGLLLMQKLAPVGAQTSNAAIARTGRLLEASPYFRHWFCI